MINYHYIKKKSFFKKLKYLEFINFKNQIDFLIKKTNIITLDEVPFIDHKSKKNYCLLTFDDGYSEHYNLVFDYLSKKKIKGNFFIPVDNFKKQKLLLVNKIQIILSLYYGDEDDLLKILYKEFNKYKIDIYKILFIWRKNKKRHLITNFDDEKVFFIKEILQNLTPVKIRKKVTHEVFQKKSKVSEEEIAKKFYISMKNIIEIKKSGMHIGAHGNTHEWMQFMSYEQQKKEVASSKKFLKKIVKSDDLLSFSYPYGSYNKNTIKILKKYKFNFGLTTEQNFFTKLDAKNQFILPRYDTVDLKYNKKLIS